MKMNTKNQGEKPSALKWKPDKALINKSVTVFLLLVFFIVCQGMLSSGSISSLMKGLLIPLCYYGIMAISLNLTVGVLGELSLGHAGFMCVGAFTSAIFSKVMQNTITNTFLRFGLAIIIGALTAAIFGVFIGAIVLRLRGDYLAIVTLAFGEIIKNVVNVIYFGKDSSGIHISTESVAALNMDETGEVIIKGAQGITGTPRNTTFAVSVILLIVCYLIIMNLMQSRTGRAIMSIRDNRIAAESIGIDITKFKILTFAISAAMAGVAGVLYAHNLASLTATTKNFGYNMSIMILVFVVLGGIGNMRGSIIAAFVLTLLPEYLRFLQDYRMLIYAIVLIVMMIYNWNPTIAAWRKSHSLRLVLRKWLFKSKKEAA